MRFIDIIVKLSEIFAAGRSQLNGFDALALQLFVGCGNYHAGVIFISKKNIVQIDATVVPLQYLSFCYNTGIW